MAFLRHEIEKRLRAVYGFSRKVLFLAAVNNCRVLLQQFLGVGGENAFLTLKLDQLLVHQLDVALWRNQCFAWILSSKKFYLKNRVLVSNKRAVATRVNLHEEMMIMMTMVMTVMMVMVIK